MQAVRGALGAEESVGEGRRAGTVSPDVSGAYERAGGGAAEVDRAQVTDAEGQVGLAVRGDAFGLAVPDGQQVAAVLAEEGVVDVENQLAVGEPAAGGERTRDVQQPYPEPVGVVAQLGGAEVREPPAQRVPGRKCLKTTSVTRSCPRTNRARAVKTASSVVMVSSTVKVPLSPSA